MGSVAPAIKVAEKTGMSLLEYGIAGIFILALIVAVGVLFWVLRCETKDNAKALAQFIKDTHEREKEWIEAVRTLSASVQHSAEITAARLEGLRK
ncbi:MAG: hypothetical protein AB7F96_22265 [Beijerinckiaceae bacterium]